MHKNIRFIHKMNEKNNQKHRKERKKNNDKKVAHTHTHTSNGANV